MKEILSSQFDAVSGDGRIAMAVEKDRLITEALVLQLVVEITAVTAGFSHSCQKTALMAAVPAPVVSGGMAVLQEMGMAAMALTERDQRIRNQTLINSCNPSTEVKFCAFMGYMMNKYVVFIKSDESRVLRKEVVTRAIIKDMKQKGFRKHHVEVDAENENDAINKLNKNSNDYLDSLKNFSGDLLLCSICVIVMVMVYLFS